MKLLTIPSGPYGTNCYVLANDRGECAIIDAPPESFDPAMDYCNQNNLKPLALFITHGHWDHTLDAWRFKEQGIPIFAHSEAKYLLENPQEMAWMAPPGMEFKGVTADHEIVQGPLDLGAFQFHLFHTPGHSPDSICLHWMDEKLCITGDLIFQLSVGRTDLPGGDKNLLSRSIKDCIFTLPEETRLLPGHGPETTVAQEKLDNPYISGF